MAGRRFLALREFPELALPDAPPDHSTISRTRRLIDLETHEAIFWMLQRLADAGLVKGKTVGIDATTLEATAALRSIVRRETGESYQDFLTKLGIVGMRPIVVRALLLPPPIDTREIRARRCVDARGLRQWNSQRRRDR